MIISKIKGTIYFSDFKFIQGRMAGEEASQMNHEEPHPHLHCFCPWDVYSITWWLLQGIIFCLIRFGRSWGGTRLWFQFSFTKPCWLFGVSVLLHYRSCCSPSPQSLLHLLSVSAQVHVISVASPCCFSSSTETRFKGDEQNRCGCTPQPLRVVKNLGSDLPNSSFVSDWACTCCQMEAMKRVSVLL